MTDNLKLANRCIDGSFETVIQSSCGLEYRIMIALPKEPPPQEGYAVIYALDGDAVFDTFAQTAWVQTRKPHGYEPVVIVGIGYPSKEIFDMNRRCYDFTTPAPSENLPVRPNGMAWPENGGADLFLDFIDFELKPQVTKLYPINPMRQTIFGHSLGGLFVLHTLFSRPESFQNYVAGSPSIWWNGRAVLDEKLKFEQSYSSRGEMPRLLFTVGEDELDHMVNDAIQLALELQQSDVVETQLIIFPEEGHVSVLPAAISRVLKFALSKPEPSQRRFRGR